MVRFSYQSAFIQTVYVIYITWLRLKTTWKLQGLVSPVGIEGKSQLTSFDSSRSHPNDLWVGLQLWEWQSDT